MTRAFNKTVDTKKLKEKLSRFSTNQMREAITLLRYQALQGMMDPRRDINQECGYPETISSFQYRAMYDREGVAQRVVSIFPEESFAMDPDIVEDEDMTTTTDFETKKDEVFLQHNLLSWYQRVDELSGIGHFGGLLYGISNSGELDTPVEGAVDTGFPKDFVPSKEHDLLYIRAFDETLIQITEYEQDTSNPRCGLPKFYNLKFTELQVTDAQQPVEVATVKKVHWSRFQHIADNLKSSIIFGSPRMMPVWNRLYDIRKVLSGSGEMFWKGALPGYSFEVNPELIAEAELDEASLKEQFDAYSNGLQRYLALKGMQAKSLAPQVSPPNQHIDAQLQAIAIALGIPLRIFKGTEEARLASSQDAATWNKRLGRRRERYISPFLIRPSIERLCCYGVLPRPKKGYSIKWPDLNAPAELDMANIAYLRMQAMSLYIQSGAVDAIPVREFFSMIMGLTHDEADAIIKAERNGGVDLAVKKQSKSAQMETKQATKQVKQKADKQGRSAPSQT